MNADYADAMNRLNDEISSALARAENSGLTKYECSEELRRIAAELVAEHLEKSRKAALEGSRKASAAR
ncbi:MAG TPA: hypothetical protein VFV12_08815 [Xanthobacteraceae bacterium]|nr:hypothetical protein [Xanthobacteraceae bacterium]